MRLKMRANAPHRGLGEHGRGREKAPLKAGTHVAQRTESGFHDAKGYQGSAKVGLGQRQSGKVPKLPRDAGHFHPLDTRIERSSRGLMGDISDTRKMGRETTSRSASARRDGFHTGKSSKGDTSILAESAAGNSKGSAPPGVGRGKGVQGSPDTHLGTAGRGGTGRIGKGDNYKGAPTKYSEDISHSAFEKLGAD
jgi:hypothetical protein